MKRRTPRTFLETDRPTRIGRASRELISHPWIQLVTAPEASESTIIPANTEDDRAA